MKQLIAAVLIVLSTSVNANSQDDAWVTLHYHQLLNCLNNQKHCASVKAGLDRLMSIGRAKVNKENAARHIEMADLHLALMLVNYYLNDD